MKQWLGRMMSYAGAAVLIIGSAIEHIEEFLRGEI